jgi:hypothetical protein
VNAVHHNPYSGSTIQSKLNEEKRLMRQRFVLILLIMIFALPLSAQIPEGWRMRVDRSQSAEDPDDRPDLTFMTMGKGFHVTGGPAGTFWNPKNVATGNYIVKTTFNLNKPSSHTNYYGLVFGGSGLETSAQTYVYFVVAQNGTYLIRQRTGDGDAVSDVKARAPHAAVKQPDGTGRSSNTLEVRVAADTVSYVVNGTVVHSGPKGALKTDGIVGFRVNHQLDLAVEGFEVTKQ